MGLRTEFFVRTPAELKAIIAANPYPDEVKSHPNHLLVHFMKAPLPDGDEAVLRAAITGPETGQGGDAELYVDFIPTTSATRCSTATGRRPRRPRSAPPATGTRC
jgi:uncharacterized protein (DUF1697 family)